ncbi:MAG: Hsp70 family protein [Synergistaceae bacterium]|jgi:actin-like ATPase involved in cell morphogenesis|nr:Hsp70 family protein [Synergistaceae bacterium]
MKTFLGIDFGTTQTSVAKIMEKAKYEPEIVEIDGNKSVYTALRLDAAGKVALFGEEALNRIYEAPEDTFYNFKADIGSDKTYRSSIGREYRPEDLALLFLRQLAKKIAEKYFNAPSLGKVEGLSCTIGCPAAWVEDRRRVLVNLAQKAGFPNVDCCDEPVGVVYYCYDRGDFSLTGPLNVLVYDFGGGTTDVAVEEVSPDENGIICEVPTILSVSERSELGDIGGRNFDKALRDHFIEQMWAAKTTFDLKNLRDLELLSKEIKEKLSIAVDDGKSSVERTASFLISHTLALSKNEFERVCEPLMGRLREPIDSALKRQPSLNAEDIGCVILAGGSSRLYYVKKGIENLFPKSEIVVSPNPVEVIAKGLALYGRFKTCGPNVVPKRQKSAPDEEAKAAGSKARSEEHTDSKDGTGPRQEKRWSQAFEWYKKAAGEGLAEVQSRLEQMFYSGRKEERSDDISAELFRKAAEQYVKAAKDGDMGATASLRKMSEEAGAMYEKNDPQKAYMWYYIASSHGSVPAKDKLDALRGKGWLSLEGWRKTVTFSRLSQEDAENAEREAGEIMNPAVNPPEPGAPNV